MKQVDTGDLKSPAYACRFDPGSGHQDSKKAQRKLRLFLSIAFGQVWQYSFILEWNLNEMTPQEIADYKLKWRSNGIAVPLHSDLDVAGKDWCRRNLERHKWAFTPHTNVYEHTFLFEDDVSAAEFVKHFKLDNHNAS